MTRKTYQAMLPCRLNDEEIKEKGQLMAKLQMDLQAEEDKKKAAMQVYNDFKKDLEPRIKGLALEINERLEVREVKVERELDFGSGKVRHVRQDTGEEFKTEAMTQNDRQQELPPSVYKMLPRAQPGKNNLAEKEDED